jgi:RNA polymerase sigma-70 factor, ECF subfamily
MARACRGEVMNAVLTASNQQTLIQARQKYKQMNDADLIAACQSRNKCAFEVLIARYQRTIYGLLYRLAPEWHDSADLAQEVYIRMWRSIATLRNTCAFKSWLHQLITNLFYDELRKRPKSTIISIDESLRSDGSDESNTRDIADISATPDELSQRRELSDAINSAIEKLPDQFKTVIVLRELEGLSYDEIALITKSEIGTVKSRIARARAKVQDMLQGFIKIAS